MRGFKDDEGGSGPLPTPTPGEQGKATCVDVSKALASLLTACLCGFEGVGDGRDCEWAIHRHTRFRLVVRLLGSRFKNLFCRPNHLCLLGSSVVLLKLISALVVSVTSEVLASFTPMSLPACQGSVLNMPLASTSRSKMTPAGIPVNVQFPGLCTPCLSQSRSCLATW